MGERVDAGEGFDGLGLGLGLEAVGDEFITRDE